MTRTKFALYQKSHHVSHITLRLTDRCLQYVDEKSFLDQRGISQEVSLLTKKGVETKSYEGVSDVKL